MKVQRKKERERRRKVAYDRVDKKEKKAREEKEGGKGRRRRLVASTLYLPSVAHLNVYYSGRLYAQYVNEI